MVAQIQPSGTLFTVRLYEPLTAANPEPGQPLDEFTFGGHETMIQITTERPGGFGAATVGLDMNPDAGFIARPIALTRPVRKLRPFAHVEILAGMRLIWEGQVTQPSLDGAGDVTGFVAQGYWSALNDGDLPTMPETELTTGTLARNVITEIASFLRIGNGEQFIDPGITRRASEFSGQPGGSVLDAVATAGDRAGNPVDYLFGPRRTLWLLPRIAPDRATHRLELGPDVDISVEWMDLYGRVRTRYQDANGDDQVTEWRTDTTFAGRYGRLRSRTLNGGRVSRAGADQAARTFLERYKTERYSYSLVLQADQGLPGVHGGYTVPWLVTCFDWVDIADRGIQPVMRTTYDSVRGTLQVDIAEQRPDWERLLRQLQDDTAAIEQGINPLTGARM
jgi:hypothetical protein